MAARVVHAEGKKRRSGPGTHGCVIRITNTFKMEFSEQKAGPYIHPTQQTLLSSDPCFAERLKTAYHSSDAHDVDMRHGLKFDLWAHHV